MASEFTASAENTDECLATLRRLGATKSAVPSGRQATEGLRDRRIRTAGFVTSEAAFMRQADRPAETEQTIGRVAEEIIKVSR